MFNFNIEYPIIFMWCWVIHTQTSVYKNVHISTLTSLSTFYIFITMIKKVVLLFAFYYLVGWVPLNFFSPWIAGNLLQVKLLD